MSNGEHFFEEMRQKSQVKVEIVKKYFSAWANVILPSVESRNGRLGYIDCFPVREFTQMEQNQHLFL